MNCLYSVWDICDDLIFRKVNESDASAFARLVGCCPAQVWGVIWFLISVAFFAGGILYVACADTAWVSWYSKRPCRNKKKTIFSMSLHEMKRGFPVHISRRSMIQ